MSYVADSAAKRVGLFLWLLFVAMLGYVIAGTIVAMVAAYTTSELVGGAS